MKFDKVRTIFFDYDGTLHNSMKIYAPSFRKVYADLVNEGYAKERQWSDKEISRWIGYNPKEMWQKFMPDLDQEKRDISSKAIGEEMNRLIRRGDPVLYENSIKTLEYLKEKGYTLVFISNCRRQYMENHRELFGLDRYFDNMICSEDHNFQEKKDILRKYLDKYPKPMLLVGDRYKDIEAGKENGLLTIGCAYGFGSKEELETSDLIIEDIHQLIEVL